MAVGFAYRRYVDKYETDDELKEYNLIKKYLLNESSITRSKKPIIWIILLVMTLIYMPLSLIFIGILLIKINFQNQP